MAAIEAGMNAADSGNNYAFSVDTTTGKVTVTGTGAFSLNFATSPSAATSCAYQLGFAAADTAAATSQTGTASCQLGIPPYLGIVISQLNPLEMVSNGTWLTFSISTGSAGNGDTIQWTRFQNYEQSYRYESLTLVRLDIQITDDRGRPISLGGVDWNLKLGLAYE
jgi:hypothetical protein